MPPRLTYLGERCEVAGWTADGSRILFRTSADQPMQHLTQLWSVALPALSSKPWPAGASGQSGRPAPLGVGVSHHLLNLSDGSYLVGRYTVDPAHTQWKGYRGGAGGHLWHGRRGGEFARVPLPADWNHTCHEKLGVRELSADASGSGVLVYMRGGELHLLALEPAAASVRPPVAPQPLPLLKGHSLLLALRGKLFGLAGLWEGPAVQCAAVMEMAARGAGGTGERTGERVVEVTSGVTRDTSPSFDPQAQYLAFLSTRSLRPSEDEVFWQLEKLACLWDNQLLYTRLKPSDAGGDGGVGGSGLRGDDGVGGADEETGAMMRCALSTCKEVRLVDNVLDFELSLDLATMALLTDEEGLLRVRVYEAGAKPAEEDDDELEVDFEQPGERSGLVDVEGRVCLTVDPRREWQQMFYEAWTAAVRHAHPSITAGLAPRAILGTYEPLLARVASYDELLDVLQEMCGELGASHAYVSAPECDGDDEDEGRQGSLGCTTEWDASLQGWRIISMVRGDPYDESQAGPLTRAAVGAKVGYVHVPDMEESGYAHFSRQFLAECHHARRVLLIDLRGNVGGVTSDVLVAKLTQRRVAIEQPPHGRPDSIPCHATPARLIVLVDENTCSDGELLGAELAAVAGALLVGSPSWGGVIGMGETELVDGTTVSHPSYAVRMDSGAALENRGLRPTVHVEAAPHDAMRGRDALLEAAIAQANELVAASERADAERGAVAGTDAEWTPIVRPHLHWSLTMLLPTREATPIRVASP
ncbi:peptidase s41 [Chrysochromulina tobinii]|uniref:Peptidase s41 n=1 Tax=Chrysochromulina tobinii TaxID=1460289 RepID=A0A0M0LS12_9EUKA|nr:peptidase s41 [Chrysochromulina tobinii]|eukprot:KOO53692.1 peptidase s41 [Chrysochromulina sp. CCMP291]